MNIEGQKLHGTFLKRINRFLAEVELGSTKVMVHVPNPARLSELLTLGADVLIEYELAKGVVDSKLFSSSNEDALECYEQLYTLLIDLGKPIKGPADKPLR